MLKNHLFLYFLPVFFWLGSIPYLFAQEKPETFIYGDLLPDAPELAARGIYGVGVRTMEFINKDQIDVMNFKD